MDTQQAQRWLSEPRYRNFLRAADGDHDATVELYVWNAEISAALLGTLHHVEVLLRNAIDHCFPDTTDSRQISICVADVWLTDPTILEDMGREKVNDAIARLIGEKRRPTRARLVASLTFGFWAALFAGRYEDLWRNYLVRAFPYGNGRRNQVRKALTRTLQVRNQIAHHEAVFGRNLAADYASILDLVAWVDPEARKYIASLSAVDGLLATAP